MSGRDSRVQARRRDDPLAVLELEQALHRLAVSGRCRHVDDARRVRRAEVREEHHGRARAAREHREHRIAFAQPRGRQILHFLLPLHPAVVRHDDDVVFFDDEVVGRVLGRLFGLDQRAPLVELRVAVQSSESASSSSRTSFQRLSSFFSSPPICLARFRFSSSSC